MTGYAGCHTRGMGHYRLLCASLCAEIGPDRRLTDPIRWLAGFASILVLTFSQPVLNAGGRVAPTHMMRSPIPDSSVEIPDIVVIGAGVVGCAVTRLFALSGARVWLLEKGPDLLSSSASKGNSAILHTGFDAPPGTLEHQCIQAGYQEYLDLREKFNLPLLETGAYVVAWTDEELDALPHIVEKAHHNHVTDVRIVDRAELLRAEPNLHPGALGAAHIPREFVIDPWSPSLAYVRQAIAHGARCFFDCEVQSGRFDGQMWALDTSRGPLKTRAVINCAGLFGDFVEAINAPSPFEIRPRKGQFVVFDKSAYPLVESIILPVPTARTKGILVTRTIFGNVLVGPTAEDVPERDYPTVDQGTLKNLIAQAIQKIPALSDHDVTAIYAGLRPATQFSEYQVRSQPDRRWITVGGIRSTGLTASLGIARHVWSLYEKEFGGSFTPAADPVWTPVPNIAENAPRAYQQPGGGEIVCHCEWVTRREIEDALGGEFPAGSLGGLKRRTRAMMGRCQGFYCGAHVAALAEGKRASAPAEGTR